MAMAFDALGSRAGAGPEAVADAARAAAGREQARGDEREQARSEPRVCEQVPSAAVHGTRYERWSYGAGEVVLVDGKVIDVLP